MDFGSLLHVAQKNNINEKAESKKYYSTKFEAPKKESKDKKLSANIQKFLQKKEEEEKEKARIAKQNLDELLSMRDTKAKNKIKKMLKVTKSANKSVLDDAIDNVNTAYTLQGPEQPDEDDYGYVSQEASQLYRTLMDKYKFIPEEKTFSTESRPASKTDLMSTKDRVRAAIVKEQEEENMPHRRQRQSNTNVANSTSASKSTESSNSHSIHRKKKNLYDPESEKKQEEELKKEEQKKKPKVWKTPPALDFRQLLQLAEKKQFEPLEVEVEVKPKEPERLLTNREKREREQREAYLAERAKRKHAKTNPRNEEEQPTKIKDTPTEGRIPKLNNSSQNEPRKMEPNGRIPKLGSTQPKIATSKSIDTKILAKSSNNLNVPPKQEVKKPTSLGEARNHIDSRKFSSTSSINSSKNSLSTSSNASKTNNSNSKGVSANNINDKSFSSSKSSSSTNGKINPITGFKKPQTISKPSSATSPKNFPSKDVIRKSIESKDIKSHQVLQSSTKNKPSVTDNHKNLKTPLADIKSKQISTTDVKTKKCPPDDIKTRKFPPDDIKTRKFPPDDTKTRKFPPDDVKTRKFPPNDVKTRKFPPDDIKTRPFPPQSAGKSRPFPPNGDRGRPFPPSDIRRSNTLKRPAKKNIIEDDDSEYDSEMDDFIDDEPEAGDYSKYIKEIFGYDKSRYRGMDEDDGNMESTFAQQMKEEYISKKIGLMEDLEDMRLEAEEKKNSKKRRRIED